MYIKICKYLFFIITILITKTIWANDDLYENQYKAGFLPTPDVPIAAGVGGIIGGLANATGQLIKNGGTNNFSFTDLGFAIAEGSGSVELAEFGPGGPMSAVWTVNGIIAKELATGVSNNLENKTKEVITTIEVNNNLENKEIE